MVVVFTILLGTSAYNYFKQSKEDMSWIHPQVILMSSILIEVIHLLFQTVHYWVYYYDGEGIFVFYVFALINKVIAQVLLIWMLLMMAYGWTISYDDLKDKDIYIIVLCFVVMIHMMITGLTFIDYGEAYKYHDFGGVQGFILILLRVLLWIGFVVGIVMTRKTAPKKTLDFLRGFLISGSLYILAFPAVWIASHFNWPYVRHRVITFGNFVI